MTNTADIYNALRGVFHNDFVTEYPMRQSRQYGHQRCVPGNQSQAP